MKLSCLFKSGVFRDYICKHVILQGILLNPDISIVNPISRFLEWSSLTASFPGSGSYGSHPQITQKRAGGPRSQVWVHSSVRAERSRVSGEVEVRAGQTHRFAPTANGVRCWRLVCLYGVDGYAPPRLAARRAWVAASSTVLVAVSTTTP